MSPKDQHEKTDAAPTLEHVLNSVMLKLKSGEDIDYDALEARNPHLMPELGKRLHDFRLFKKSVNKAKSRQLLHKAAIHDPEPDEDMASLGAALPEYEMIERIDCGGQGAVYKAYHGPSRRTVAVKLLTRSPSSSAVQRGRFDREVALLKRLEHPNIISLTGHGLLNGRPYLITDYIDGLTLGEYVMFHDLPVRKRVELFVKVCDAVHAAHQKGVLHRDLKPTNIIVDLKGEPRVLDFGLAKDLVAEPGNKSSDWSSHHRLVGTLPYLSPEQASQAVDTGDIRSDVYTLGVMLFQVITDTLPYSVEGDDQSIQRRILEQKPRRLREALAIDGSAEAEGYESSITDDLESILAKTLSKQPDARYRSAAHLADDLRRFLDGSPVGAKGDSLLYTLGKIIARNKGLFGLAVGAVLLFGLLAGVLLGQIRRADSAQATTDFRTAYARHRSLDSWNDRLSSLRIDQAIESLDGEYDTLQSQRVIARARAAPIRLENQFAIVADGAEMQLLEWMKDPQHPDYSTGERILSEASDVLDSIARAIEFSPVEFPMGQGDGFAIVRDHGALPSGYLTARAFVARAYSRLHADDTSAMLADLGAARLLAGDLAVGWTTGYVSARRDILEALYRFADRALLELADRDRYLEPLVSWVFEEPRTSVDLSAALEFHAYAISEWLQACCVADGPDGDYVVNADIFEDMLGVDLNEAQRNALGASTCQELEALIAAYDACMARAEILDHDSLSALGLFCSNSLGGLTENSPLRHISPGLEQNFLADMNTLSLRSRVRFRAIALRHRLAHGDLPAISDLREKFPSDSDRINPHTKKPWSDRELAEILSELAGDLE